MSAKKGNREQKVGTAKKKNSDKSENREAFRFLVSYIKRHIWSVISGVIVLIGVDLAQIIIPRIVQRTIDMLGGTAFSNEVVVKNTVYMLLLATGMIFLRFLWRVFLVGASRKIEKEVRGDMFSHMQTLSFNYFNKTQTGELMALMVNDVNAVRMATGMAFIALTDAIFMGTLSLFSMFSINVKLTFFTIIPLPFILLMAFKYGPLIQSRFKAVQESFASISAHTQESFSGVRVVKGFAREKSEAEGFGKKCDDYVAKNMLLIRVWGFFFPAVTLLASLSLAMLYLVGGRSVIIGTLTFGEFISMTLYINLLIWPVMAVGWVFNLLQRGIASSKRILDLLKTEPEIFDSERVDKGIKKVEGGIKTKDLTFRYSADGSKVLDCVNLNVPAGSSLGIMGKPGSGKSTLVSLFFRLFPIDDGEIFIDGLEISRFPLNVLRRSIGYVPQEPFLFSDTIRNNISIGLDESSVSIEEIERIASLTAIYNEIEAFGDRFDTLVGERGVTLSGGQKQRLSIARALAIKPRILILDDAFSAVDASTEQEVLSNVFAEAGDITLIIISHRVSTVKDCDSIIVLERGSIIEQGTHDSLVGKGGYYCKLHELQKLEEQAG
jgi:ATP-binding cassette subfamily B multidrug efflux pump